MSFPINTPILQSSMSYSECLLAVDRWVQWPLCRHIAYCFLVWLDQAFKHYNSRAATEWRQMIHKNRICVCGASFRLLWLDGHFCSAPILCQTITSVCVCVCVCVRVCVRACECVVPTERRGEVGM